MLCGRLQPSRKYRVDSMEMMLKKIFPNADFIVLSDSDDENNNEESSLLTEIIVDNENAINEEISKCLHHEFNDDSSVDDVLVPLLKKNISEKNIPVEPKKIKARRPSMCVPSIAEYSIKTQKLPPSSAYAKKSKIDKPALSLNYKETKPIVKAPYDPKEEAIKLNNIKEKIYCKKFLKLDDQKKEVKNEVTAKKDEKVTVKEEEKKKAQNNSLASTSSEVKLQKKSPLKVKQRSNSLISEVIELSESDDEFKKIPILKTCRPVRQCWRPV